MLFPIENRTTGQAALKSFRSEGYPFCALFGAAYAPIRGYARLALTFPPSRSTASSPLYFPSGRKSECAIKAECRLEYIVWIRAKRRRWERRGGGGSREDSWWCRCRIWLVIEG